MVVVLVVCLFLGQGPLAAPVGLELYGDQVDLKLTKIHLPLSLSARTKGMCHHAWLSRKFFITNTNTIQKRKKYFKKIMKLKSVYSPKALLRLLVIRTDNNCKLYTLRNICIQSTGSNTCGSIVSNYKHEHGPGGVLRL